jgi:hypothetical protein
LLAGKMGQLDLESGINTLDLYQERLRNILGGLLEYLFRFLPQNPHFCRSNITVDLLTQDGKCAFVSTWKNFEYPKQWQKLPNPVYYHDSFMMSDCICLSMMMPFILDRFLCHNYIKNTNLTMIQQRCNVSRKDTAAKLVVKCWSVVAETMTIVFKKTYSENDYILLYKQLKEEMEILSKVSNYYIMKIFF